MTTHRNSNYKLKSRITHFEKKAERAVNDYRTELIDVQASCEHPKIVEGQYSPGKYLGSLPPFRVCTCCGYAEEGWGCGYSLLDARDKDVEEVTRDKAQKYVKGIVLPNDVHFKAKRSGTSLKSRRQSLRRILDEHQEVTF